MYRAVLLTDLHLRSDYLPGYLDAQLETFTKLVNRKPPDGVIINGDIFHRRNPRGAELLAFRRLLEGLNTREIFINRGNHDTIAKDGSTETTLSLFSDIATVLSETTTVRLGTADFDFIPHFEDESKIVRDLKSSKNHIFGHWGFDGCVANGAYEYASYIKKSHIGTKRFAFLGHIHKPKQYGKNVFVLGTAHSTSFGEANAQKFVHELLVRDGVVEVVRKPVDFGIRHVAATLDTLEACASRFRFDSFFTILRVKMDHLDSGTERQLVDKILAKHNVKHLEVVFEDVLPKYEASHIDYDELLQLDESVIEQYIENSSSIFSKKDLLKALEEIRKYEA